MCANCSSKLAQGIRPYLTHPAITLGAERKLAYIIVGFIGPVILKVNASSNSIREINYNYKHRSVDSPYLESATMMSMRHIIERLEIYLQRPKHHISAVLSLRKTKWA